MKIVLYGIGKRYYDLISLDEEADIGLIKRRLEVIGFSDGDSKKWGMPITYDGQQFIIRNIEDFDVENFDRIVITTIQKYEEIRFELIKKGFKREQILLIDEIFEANPEQINYVDDSFFCKQWTKSHRIDGIKRFLQEKKYQEIAVYGMGRISEHLIDELKKSTDISIKYLIFPNENQKEDNGFIIYRPNTELPPADLIIVAVLENYMEIESTICEKNRIEVISIQELVYKALKNVRGLERYA